MGTERPIRIATRGSALALAQAQMVLARCSAAFPGRFFEVHVIKTTGDKLQTASLTSGTLPKGLFTKELETALLNGEADLAVHSLKDLPTELPAGLELAAVLPRADPRDVLVYRHIEAIACPPDASRPVQQQRRGFKPELSIAGLPHGATLGTSSTRREAAIRELRPDVRIVPLRGNVGTRLLKLAAQPELDAIVLAAAGLERLGCHFPPGGLLAGPDVPAGLAVTPLTFGEMLPCVGQAAIAIESRVGDKALVELRDALNHAETFACVTAERAFLSAMGGGCNLAVGALAVFEGDQLRLRGVSFLGKAARRAEARRGPSEAAELGHELAGLLLA